MTMEGTARAVPGDPLPLGLSRGPRITRPKQLDFMHRFMSSPLVPSFAGDASNGGEGLLLHHAHTLHLTDNWSATVLEQFNVQNFMSLVKEHVSMNLDTMSWIKTISKHMNDLFSLGFGTEFLVTPDSSFLIESYNVKKKSRGKAIFQHKFPQHNLTMEAVYPGLFVDKHGTYWDVPLSMAVDLASVKPYSRFNYHFCLQHNSGQPTHFGGNQNIEPPMSLLPGLCAKAVISIKKSVEFWRKKEGKLKLVQPYDALLSNPHVSGSGVLGATAIASFGDNSARLLVENRQMTSKAFSLCGDNNLVLFADLFATFLFSAQHGNFQRLAFDLTRLNARMNIPSGSTFVSGVVRLADKLYNSQVPDSEAIRAVCPELTVSLQQQIIGPFSFRMDSNIKVDPENKKCFAHVDESVYAIDWALKVLGSAKASFWYAPKRKEAMVELRFFES